MKSNIVQFQRPFVLTENFEYVDIGYGFYAYQHQLQSEQGVKLTKQAKDLIATKKHGIVSQKQLEKYLKGTLSTSDFDAQVYVISQDLINLVRNYGYLALQNSSDLLDSLNGASQFELASKGYLQVRTFIALIGLITTYLHLLVLLWFRLFCLTT